jgi:hypothetical protein
MRGAIPNLQIESSVYLFRDAWLKYGYYNKVLPSGESSRRALLKVSTLTELAL